MQLIAEAYDMLRRCLGLEPDELGDIFAEWNKGVLSSFLIEITAEIFKYKDPETGKALVDLVMDKAGQKGTGLWTSHVALDFGIAIPTIESALAARMMSGLKSQRIEASKVLQGPQDSRYGGDKAEFVAAVHDALYASKICSYAQGMALIKSASDKNNWGFDLGEISRIWKGGCIIRAQFLDKIKQAYLRRSDLPNLLVDPDFSDFVNAAQANWRKAVTTAQSLGVPCLAMASSLAYFDSYRSENLPQNLTQAQRDFFGSHTYERVDKPELGFIHTEWRKKAE
jgi:6-phosphogluconate dehydrogenase